jgi:hypothetical protein
VIPASSIVGHNRTDIGIQIAQFPVVVRPPYGFRNFSEAQVGDRQDQSGIDLLAAGIDKSVGPRWRREAFANLQDLALIDQDGTVTDYLSIANMHGAVNDAQASVIGHGRINVCLGRSNGRWNQRKKEKEIFTHKSVCLVARIRSVSVIFNRDQAILGGMVPTTHLVLKAGYRGLHRTS